MGILLSAMAAAGDQGVKSMDQNIDQQNRLDLDAKRSELETQKAKALIDYQKRAQLDAENERRQGVSDRVGAAKAGVIDATVADKYADSDSAVAAAGAGKTDAPLTPEQQAAIEQSKGLDRESLAKDPHSYIRAAMASGDIDPKEVAQLVQQADAMKRQELAQQAQFDHADKSQAAQFAQAQASQAASQAFAASQQSRSQAFQAGENQKSRDLTKEKLMPPADITDAEKKNWVHTYITGNGSVPRSAPGYVRNAIGTWAAQAGITPDDIAKGTAQTKFDQAAANTSGHRAGAMASVEATMPALTANALELSQKIDKTRFMPINKLMMMSETQLQDNPDLAALKLGHMAVVSEYQQVISRGGTNVTALKEAMHLLNDAAGPASYASAMRQVDKEVEINVAGTAKVRANLGGSHTPISTPIIAPIGAPKAGGKLIYNPATGAFN